jgi:hypothetical protein
VRWPNQQRILDEVPRLLASGVKRLLVGCVRGIKRLPFSALHDAPRVPDYILVDDDTLEEVNRDWDTPADPDLPF